MTREEALETLIDNAENGYVDIEEVKLVFSELEQEPKWIPVNERLPKDETCVLTTIKIPNRIARVRSGWYDNDNGGFFHNDNGDVWKATDMEVLAWMPSPKPYKEGKEE